MEYYGVLVVVTRRPRCGMPDRTGTNTLKGHGSCVYSATYSLDSQRIVTSSDDETAKVWDAETG